MFLFYRGVIAYAALTLAFWLMSWAMVYNHANYVWNPAWQLITALRDGFTWFGIACVGLAVLMLILEKLFLYSSEESSSNYHIAKVPTPEELEARKLERERLDREQELAKQKEIRDQKRERERREKE